MKDRIMVFIPMYNCERQITRVLAQFDGEIAHYVAQIVIVNNRSTDGGEAVVEKYLREKPLCVPVTLLRNDENYGLGGSHKVAFQYALAHGFDYLVVLHGDDQGHIEDLLPHLKSGAYRAYDGFLGARFMAGSRLEGYSRFRTFGNRVYNLLFSLVARRWIYDLGSGLNLYRVAALKTKFYEKFRDNLEFNYCMILGESYLRQNIGFFPIRWSESDQVSNVKLTRQAFSVLGLLGAYFLAPKKFLRAEHREKPPAGYTAQEVFRTEGKA